MRLTLNIDGDLLDRVVAHLGAKTKTEAIHHALQEIDRRHQLHHILSEGLGLTPDELENMVDPASDPMRLRVAEPQAPYGEESR
jgi:hypothetical protein